MKKHAVGDKVTLNRAGVFNIRDTFDDEDRPSFDGEATITLVNSYGLLYVDGGDWANWFDDEHLEPVVKFPKKVRAYEVRLGDVVKNAKGEKFAVELLEQDTQELGDKVYMGGYFGEKWVTMAPAATSKVKVFERKYK